MRSPMMLLFLMLVGVLCCDGFAVDYTYEASGKEEPVQVITHFKIPGSGYIPGSPLYKEQQAANAAAKTTTTIRPVVVAAAHIAEPVSTSMRCIINLVTQFFVVSIAVFIVKALSHCGVLERKTTLKSLIEVGRTIFFVPMLVVLFLAVRMHAVHLTQGNPDKYGLPQWWVKDSMIFCSWAVLWLSVLVFIGASIWGAQWQEEARGNQRSLGNQVLSMACRVVTFVIYGCITLICVGINNMQAPQELWGDHHTFPVNTVSNCTVVLSVTYFMVYLAQVIGKVGNEFGVFGQPQRFGKPQDILKTATMTVAFAPMLCVLMISTRLRAYQINPLKGDPQPWVKVSLYVCTFSVLAQTALAVFGAYIGLEVDPMSIDDDMLSSKHPPDEIQFDAHKEKVGFGALPLAGKAIEGCRLIAMVCLYVGAAVVVAGLVLMKPPGDTDSPATAPPMPTSLLCVILLSAMYFMVYMKLWIVIAMQRYGSKAENAPEMVVQEPDHLLLMRIFLEKFAREAVAFCPMLCILFMGTFMRALQITEGLGAPQEWCQDAEWVASLCVVVMTFVRVDVLSPSSRQSTSGMCTALSYACQTAIYLCASLVVVALVTMTPETAVGPA